MSLHDAYNYVHSKRCVVRPNNAFFKQLIEYEKKHNSGKASVKMVTIERAGVMVEIPDFFEKEHHRFVVLEALKEKAKAKHRSEKAAAAAAAEPKPDTKASAAEATTSTSEPAGTSSGTKTLAVEPKSPKPVIKASKSSKLKKPRGGIKLGEDRTVMEEEDEEAEEQKDKKPGKSTKKSGKKSH